MKRADFMSFEQKKAMGVAPRTHEACKRLTGVSRPGKTSQQKARKLNGIKDS